MTDVITEIVNESTLFETDRAPQRRRVVEDHVDPDELLEHRERDADPDDRFQSECRAAQGALAIGEAVGLDALLQVLDAAIDIRVAPEPDEDLAGLVIVALQQQVARRLREGQRDRAVDDRRDHADQEHPAPGGEPPPERRIRAARDVGEQGVREQRGEDAERDRELLQRAQPTTDLLRRDLGDVRRGDHRGDADAEAADDAPDDEVGDPERETGSDRADEEQDRPDDHGRDATPAIGEATRQVGADRASEQRARDGEPGQRAAETEGLLHRVDRAVDHRGVEAEEETADGARDREADDLPIDAGLGRGVRGGHDVTLLPGLEADSGVDFRSSAGARSAASNESSGTGIDSGRIAVASARA